MNPFVSVIIPCFNEEKYIRSLIENILHQDYPGDSLEVFIIDGMSKDHTREIIEEYHKQHPCIHLLLNEKRFVPFALNLGIKKSQGDVVIRIDAHSEYPVNYISTLVRYLFEIQADNVGGICITKPANDSAKANSIAIALTSSFGVGDSYFRVGVKEIRKVDTVPFGCFRRSLFDRIGMFDEELLRNQDDEFNARINENGGSIYLIPDVAITYYARPDISSLLKTFFQYAFFKPLVNRKLKKPATIRQFIPPLFVLFLCFGWAGGLLFQALLLTYFTGIGLYVAANLWFTARGALNNRKGNLVFYLPWIFFLQHLAYGTGYLAGILHFSILRKSPTTVYSSR